MDETRLDALKGQLLTTPQNAGLKSASRIRRTQNIQCVSNLSRVGLEFGAVEIEIDLVKTSAREVLSIRYPGKESANGLKPWDFRPKVRRADGEHGADLTFKGIWDGLFDTLEPIHRDHPMIAETIATIFYRMAFMLDHVWEEPRQSPCKRLDLRAGGTTDDVVELGGHWKYQPSQEIVDALSAIVPQFAGMSLMAFLHYNELLAWNEDCKYYHRDVVVGDKAWLGSSGKIGRINNLLTHVAVIGLIVGDVRLSALLDRFSRQRGVAPATNEEIGRITDGLVE